MFCTQIVDAVEKKIYVKIVFGDNVWITYISRAVQEVVDGLIQKFFTTRIYRRSLTAVHIEHIVNNEAFSDCMLDKASVET